MFRFVTRFALCLGVMFAALGDASAQNPRSRDLSVSQIFAVQHSHASNLVATLRELLGAEVNLVADNHAGKIIAVAEDKVSLQHLEALLRELDVPSTNQPQRSTHTYVTKFRTARSLERILQVHVPTYAIDDARNSIVYTCDSAELLSRVQTALTDADARPASMRLECWLLNAASGRPVAEHPELKDIAKELDAMNLGGYRVFGRAALVTLDTEAFELDQQFGAQKPDESSSDRRPAEPKRVAYDALSLQGKIGLNRENEYTVELRTKLTLGGAQINFRNTLRTRDGVPLIVGFAPAGGEQTDPIVLVLKVTKQP
ncbi:MAG: hypothetical protein ACKVX7_16215 [Planctomycetota bacterium]